MEPGCIWLFRFPFTHPPTGSCGDISEARAAWCGEAPNKAGGDMGGVSPSATSAPLWQCWGAASSALLWLGCVRVPMWCVASVRLRCAAGITSLWALLEVTWACCFCDCLSHECRVRGGEEVHVPGFVLHQVIFRRPPSPMGGRVLSPWGSERGCWAEVLHSFPRAAPTKPQAQLSEMRAKSFKNQLLQPLLVWLSG